MPISLEFEEAEIAALALGNFSANIATSSASGAAARAGHYCAAKADMLRRRLDAFIEKERRVRDLLIEEEING